MMQKYKDSHLCTFVNCYPTPLYLQQQDVLLKYNKRETKGEKISLRRVQSRSELANTQQKSEQYQEKIKQINSPLYTQTVNNTAVTPRIITCPVSPKPKITFAWKTDLERTKKAQNKEQFQSTPIKVDPQLQKTKPVSKKLKIPNNLNLSTYKASLISISDEEQKHTPKVEQSLIVVNYFNPTIQQKKTLQTFLERRESDEQN